MEPDRGNKVGPRSDDSTLVADARMGSDRAFAAIVRKYSTSLWNLASALSDNVFNDAQDLMQETFVRAYNRLHTLQSPAALGAWLAMLMRRLAANRRTRMSHRRNLLDYYALDSSRALGNSATQTGEELLLSKELGDVIEEALGHLSRSSREVFCAFHVEGRSIAEISRVTGLSASAVKARLFQSRNKLRKELELMAPEPAMTRRMPTKLNMVHMGNYEHQDDPLHPVRLTRRLLSRRFLFACRKTPKNADELATVLQADRAYVEDLVPDLVAGELLQEVSPDRYLTSFLFATRTELNEMASGICVIDECVSILRRRLPDFEAALEATDLHSRQGYDWPYLAWIAVPVWVMRGLARQVDCLDAWRKHRIFIYPIRPIDFWHGPVSS